MLGKGHLIEQEHSITLGWQQRMSWLGEQDRHPPTLLLRCTPALNRPGELQLVKTPQFSPAWFVFRETANEDTLIQARCVGVLCMYVGKMDQAHKFILQRTSSQHEVMISSRYRPQTRLLSPDDSKLKHSRAMPADTWAL